MKWPRQYAAEIMALKTKQERRESLNRVPEWCRDMVADHVTSAFMLARFKRK